MTRFELLAPALILCALIATSIMASVIHKRLPAHWRDEETNTTIQLTAGLFTVLTALVLGLMLNSAKNTFESVDRNVHVYGTEIVLLDRTLRRFGPEAMDARNRLLAFARLAMRERPNDHQGILADRRLEGPLDTVGDALNSIKPLDEQHVDLLHDAQQQFQKLVETHWTLIGQAEGPFRLR